MLFWLYRVLGIHFWCQIGFGGHNLKTNRKVVRGRPVFLENCLVQRNKYRFGNETDLVSNIVSTSLLALACEASCQTSLNQFLYLKMGKFMPTSWDVLRD